jgi:hypothetical protein
MPPLLMLRVRANSPSTGSMTKHFFEGLAQIKFSVVHPLPCVSRKLTLLGLNFVLLNPSPFDLRYLGRQKCV